MDSNSIEQLRAQGNACYRDGRYEQARALYASALDLLINQHQEDGSLDSGNTLENREAVAQLYSNRAQAFIQERDFAAALHDAKQALAWNADSEKARMRELVALENLERFRVALAAADAILDRKGAREEWPALFQYAIMARRRLRKNMQRDQAVAVQELNQMGKMVHENQQLRINLGCLLPSQLPLGHFTDVLVSIGNEFGLFRRSYLAPGERIHLRASLRNNDDNKFKLVVQDHPDNAGSAANTREDGSLALDDRGKVMFRAAITLRDQSLKDHIERENMSLMITVHADSASKWNLLGVVSLPFTVVAATSAEVEGSTGALGIHCCRAVAMPGLNREIILAESPGSLGIGGKLWDSCLVLTRYLSDHQDLLRNKRVVELGSGIGLVGIYCAKLGAASVTLTDMEDVVELLTYNIGLNFTQPANTEPVQRAHAEPHLWGTSIANLPENPEVIVLSDVVYDPEGYVPLVTSLDALARPGTAILMAHRSRNPMEHQFFALLSEKFHYELIDWASELKEDVDATSSSNELVLQDVKIFRLQRK